MKFVFKSSLEWCIVSRRKDVKEILHRLSFAMKYFQLVIVLHARHSDFFIVKNEIHYTKYNSFLCYTIIEYMRRDIFIFMK